jgi:hypothetical protein
MKILFMSGYPDAALAEHGAPPGEMPLIQKPFAAATLARRVRDVLDRPAA